MDFLSFNAKKDWTPVKSKPLFKKLKLTAICRKNNLHRTIRMKTPLKATNELFKTVTVISMPKLKLTGQF